MQGGKRLKSDYCSHGPSFSLCLWKPLCTKRAPRQVRGRVKSVYSVVKKLLRQRGVSREDLKAQALKASNLYNRRVN